jgi:hypothetical protein
MATPPHVTALPAMAEQEDCSEDELGGQYGDSGGDGAVEVIFS